VMPTILSACKECCYANAFAHSKPAALMLCLTVSDDTEKTLLFQDALWMYTKVV